MTGFCVCAFRPGRQASAFDRPLCAFWFACWASRSARWGVPPLGTQQSGCVFVRATPACSGNVGALDWGGGILGFDNIAHLLLQSPLAPPQLDASRVCMAVPGNVAAGASLRHSSPSGSSTRLHRCEAWLRCTSIRGRTKGSGAHTHTHTHLDSERRMARPYMCCCPLVRPAHCSALLRHSYSKLLRT